MQKYILIANELLAGNEINFITNSVGGGEWTIELHTKDGYLCEYSGSNGTREEATDLWSIIRKDFNAAKGHLAVLFGGGYISK